MEHDLKIWPAYFAPVASGIKRFEMRANDRDYKAGDALLLREWNPQTKEYTGRAVKVGITHVLRINELDAGLKSIMGLNPCPAKLNDMAILSITRI
jgi:hypothetical protein